MEGLAFCPEVIYTFCILLDFYQFSKLLTLRRLKSFKHMAPQWMQLLKFEKRFFSKRGFAEQRIHFTFCTTFFLLPI